MTDAQAARIAWMERATNFVDDDTMQYELEPRPEDPVLRGALAVMERYGLWSDPVLSPHELVILVETAQGGVMQPWIDNLNRCGTQLAKEQRLADDLAEALYRFASFGDRELVKRALAAYRVARSTDE